MAAAPGVRTVTVAVSVACTGTRRPSVRNRVALQWAVPVPVHGMVHPCMRQPYGTTHGAQVCSALKPQAAERK